MIFNQKGGVGKSTSVVNIAGCLAGKLKKRVLVIDTDGQCTSTSYLSTIQGRPETTLLDYIKGEESLSDIIYTVVLEKWDKKQRKKVLYKPNISLIPSDDYFKTMTDSEAKELFNENLFVEMFERIEENFDYCIIDCPGYISPLVECVLRTIDYILVPAFADVDSLMGFGDIINTKNRIQATSDNISLDILGVFFTSFTTTGSVNRQIRDMCLETMGEEIIFKSKIRRAAAILDARVLGLPVSLYKPHEPVSEDYLALTKEIIKRIAERG